MRDQNLEINPDFIQSLKQGPQNQAISKGMSSDMPAIIKRVIAHKFFWDSSDMAPQDVHGIVYNMPGVLVGDAVALGIPQAAMSGNIFFVAYVFALGQVAMRCHNPTAATVNRGAGEYSFVVFRI